MVIVLESELILRNAAETIPVVVIFPVMTTVLLDAPRAKSRPCAPLPAVVISPLMFSVLAVVFWNK